MLLTVVLFFLRMTTTAVQQWEITEENVIRLKCSKKLVLGVSLPLICNQQADETQLEGAAVTLQAAK